MRRRLITDGDELMVRNAFKTVRLHRSEIAEVRQGRGSGGAGARMIVVVPHRGDLVSVEVSGQLLSRQGDQLSTALADLQAWLAV